jgi:hypothetical protein
LADIKWKPLSETLGEKFEDNHCNIDRIATFDLNNDGHSDIVVKFSGCFKSRLTDYIFFLNVDEQVFSTYSYDDIVSNSIGRFPADYGVLSSYLLRTPIEKKVEQLLRLKG